MGTTGFGYFNVGQPLILKQNVILNSILVSVFLSAIFPLSRKQSLQYAHQVIFASNSLTLGLEAKAERSELPPSLQL